MRMSAGSITCGLGDSARTADNGDIGACNTAASMPANSSNAKVEVMSLGLIILYRGCSDITPADMPIIMTAPIIPPGTPKPIATTARMNFNANSSNSKLS